jgi:hypothetical protein
MLLLLLLLLQLTAGSVCAAIAPATSPPATSRNSIQGADLQVG